MNHSFDIDLAKEYGIEEAIMIENIAFWIKKNMANNKHFIENKYWTFNSARAFNELFPYMNPSKINRTLKKLEKLGILEIGNHNKAAYDKTSWFTIVNEEILEKYKLIPDNYSFCKMKNGFIKMENGFCNLQDRFSQNAKPIPDVNTDINTDIKNKHVTCLDLKKSEKKIMLGINPKGYPQKDEWEKFLNENLVGIDYIPSIEKAIKNLLKTETPASVEKILLETYKTGIDTGRNVSEIATIISKGNALRAKNTKSEKKKKVVVGQKKEQEIVKPKIIESTPITDAVLEQKKEQEFLDDKFNRLTKEQQENLLNKASELAKMQSNGLEVFEKMLANGKIKYDLLREINIGGENEKNNF